MMIKRLLVVLAIAQLLLTSTWASTHMAEKNHSGAELVPIALSFFSGHLKPSSDHHDHLHNYTENHAEDHSAQHEHSDHQGHDHTHIYSCALSQYQTSFLSPRNHKPSEQTYQPLLIYLGPDNPPPKASRV